MSGAAPELAFASTVNMGNPHAIFFVADAAAIDLAALGPRYETHPMFPEKANVTFAQMLARDDILARVWERGVGITLACGSAACATLVAATRLGLADRRARVRLPGGDLEIEWRAADDHVLMTGPVVFEREITLDAFAVREMRESRRFVTVAEVSSRERAAGGRVDAVDGARAVALIGMAVYHFTWDLANFDLISPDLPFTPGMRLLSHTIGSAFLLLVGVSLALAHRGGFRARSFLRRLATVAGAAVLVTLASMEFAPSQPIDFGILHCIAAASLLAAAFLNAPPFVAIAVGVAGFAAPFLATSSAFNSPALLWIGLGDVEPQTLDWRPLLPWGAVALVGLGVARFPAVDARLRSPTRWRARSRLARGMTFAGRHSLIVYLVHQPMLIGLLYAATVWGGLGAGEHVSGFKAACERTCVSTGREAGACASACACVSDLVNSSPLGKRLAAGALSDSERAELKRMAAPVRSLKGS